MSEIQNLRLVIAEVLDEVASSFPDDTAKNVQELLSHGEPGVALEILCTQLAEYEIEVAPDSKSRLRLAAELLGMSWTALWGANSPP
ncbi:MafI family immunity protein [Cupriavidus pauculus]|uniref:MafI family immunity protein n=1 Tax=Cupriavidus pauculus TaxID=82633 RepID=A0A3G8H3J2_9BURK|nr:MafI family immunity protein [Cupriavidus pauculus]AZG14879.1 MafI family immunity protein [Cupriavidus pauculus]